MAKVVSIAATREENDLDKFFRDTLAEIKASGQTKIMIVSLNENDGYYHSLASTNIKASEAIALLAITQAELIKRM